QSQAGAGGCRASRARGIPRRARNHPREEPAHEDAHRARVLRRAALRSRRITSRFFAAVVRRRWYVLACYALLLPPSAYFAAHVRQDNSIDRLIVATDPDYVATRAFEKVFGAGEFALLLAEADDPLAPAVVAYVDRVERAVAGVPRVTTNSALSIFRRA